MTSMLEGPLKAAIAQAFKGRLRQGRIRRVASSTLNAYGDPVPGVASTFTFEGIRENFDAKYRAQAGIPDKDVSILVLLGSVKPATTPIQTDQIYINGLWHAVRHILEIDPADASCKLQGYEIPDPT